MRPVILALTLALALPGCGVVVVPSADELPSALPVTQTSASDPVRASLAKLPVRPRASMAGYRRDAFGTPWFDVDRNRCDTRNDVLARDLDGETFVTGSRCLVAAGSLADPYTGRRVTFTRGAATSDDVQIDHLVSLGGAWSTGAQLLDPVTRRALANDPANLQATDGPTNQAKSDSDASEWLPSNLGYRCEFVARQIAVKVRYKLWVTSSERAAMEAVLGTCST